LKTKKQLNEIQKSCETAGETLPAGKFRHRDHRFEWTRVEFPAWANGVATRFGYNVRFLTVGPEDATVGSPTQMGVFTQQAKIQGETLKHRFH
jgi:hypothetical protein